MLSQLTRAEITSNDNSAGIQVSSVYELIKYTVRPIRLDVTVAKGAVVDGDLMRSYVLCNNVDSVTHMD